MIDAAIGALMDADEAGENIVPLRRYLPALRLLWPYRPAATESTHDC